MTKLTEEAFHRLRQLPDAMQDSAARAVIHQLEEEPELGDREAIAEALNQFERGEFLTLEQWRHGDMKWGLVIANRAKRQLRRLSPITETVLTRRFLRCARIRSKETPNTFGASMR